MGFVFIFDIVNVKDGPTRYKHASYYSLALLENALLLALWYTKSGGVDVSTSSLIKLLLKIYENQQNIKHRVLFVCRIIYFIFPS